MGVLVSIDHPRLTRTWSFPDLPGHTTTTAYDQLGRVSTVNGPVGAQTFTYEAATGRADQTMLDGVVLADVAYDEFGRMGSVAYANGTSLTPGYDRYGRSDTTTFLSADGITPLARDQVTRSLGARVTDQLVDRGSIFEDPYPTGDNMVYDGAGRLVSWRGVGAVKETYGYDASTCPLGSPQAGRNTNLVSVTRNGTVTQSSCFDAADRIVSTTGKASMTYDDHGNTTTLGTQAYRYDAADRHMGIDAGTETMSYTRDPLDRLVGRQGATTQRYRYANMGDSPDFSVDASGAVTERYLSLAGGVNVTSRGPDPDLVLSQSPW